MIVNQTNAANQGQNQYPPIAPFKNSRRALSACAVAGCIISLVRYILFLTAIHFRLIHFPPIWIWILQFTVFCLDISIHLIAAASIPETFDETFDQRCPFWAAVHIFQILNVVYYTGMVWIDNDPIVTIAIVLTWVKCALLVVISILSIILNRKHQRNNDTIRYSNFEPANVTTNINDRGQVAIVGRRPQNQDYLAQLSVVSETLYNDLPVPPRYEDLDHDQPPTYEESLQLQQQE